MKVQIAQMVQQLYDNSRLHLSSLKLAELQERNLQLQKALKERDAQIQELHTQLANQQAQLKELQGTDELTTLSNQYTFHGNLSRALKRALRLGYSLSIMLVDIDQLREIDLRYGAETGDRVLAEVAKILRCSVREIDVPARWSEHELIAVLHETSAEAASAVAERIRKRICMLELPDSDTGRLIKITASIAISSYPRHGSTPESLLEYAAEAMKEAKERGHNAIVVAAT
jgi:diguanylate cyclase (GGDEF)-like protein